MPSNDNSRTCICKHITPLDTCWAILSSFFGPAWVISSNSDHFCRASLGHVEQFWTVFENTIWHCRPWTVFNMSQSRLLWDILLWLKKVADVNPTDLDPKVRSVRIRYWNILDTWNPDLRLRGEHTTWFDRSELMGQFSNIRSSKWFHRQNLMRKFERDTISIHFLNIPDS